MGAKRFGWLAAALAALALALLAATPAPAAAVDRRSGNRVVVGAGEVVEDDLIVAGDSFVLDGRVQGDLIVTAGRIEINGVVQGDLIAAGGAVTLAGTVEDDVRIAGATLRLAPGARVGDDLLAGGMSLELAPGSQVGGALMFGGGQALLAGAVAEEVLFGGDGLELRGTVGRGVEASVGEGSGPAWASQTRFEGVPPPPAVRSGLTVAEGARIGGDLTYTSRRDFSIPPGAVAGRVVYNQRPMGAPRDSGAGATALDLLRRYAALLLVGLLLVWLAPRVTRGVSSKLEAQPLASLGWGFISILAIALAFLLVLLATVFLAVLLGLVKLNGLMGLVIATGGLALLALVVLTIIAIAYVAQIAVSYEAGRLILQRLRPAWLERPYAPLALGLALLVLLTAVPVVGWLFSLAAALLGLGALWLFGRDAVLHRPIPAPAQE
ncbi:MAG TPA: polymer-forming cytoskeletal protein [Roseiflexaceae bacterium]|nr:polymer-forming cytoskeletal protein [Roseiflexaceae bacterium]